MDCIHTGAAGDLPTVPAVQRHNRKELSMAAPTVSMQQLIEAGAHFGHQTHRWNPRMKPYIFGARNGVHIIDLSQTVPLFARALDFVESTVRSGGKVLFVGTKASGAGADCRGCTSQRPAFRQSPLAGRDADELENHFRFHQTAENP